MLKNGLLRKEKFVLLNLVSKQRELRNKSEMQEQIKKNALLRMMDGQKLDARTALRKLVSNRKSLEN